MLPLATFAASAAIGVGKSIAGSVAASASRPDAAGPNVANSSASKARKTATEFESMFLENAVDRMMQSEGTEGPLGENGTGGGVWRSMLTKEYAGSIVKSGGVGIADQVFRELMKLQGAAGGGSHAGTV